MKEEKENVGALHSLFEEALYISLGDIEIPGWKYLGGGTYVNSFGIRMQVYSIPIFNNNQTKDLIK